MLVSARLIRSLLLPTCLLAGAAGVAGCGGDRSPMEGVGGARGGSGGSDAASGGYPTVPGDAVASGRYPNLFKELLGKSDADIQAKVDAAYAFYFAGDPAEERLYFEADDDEAYIWAADDVVITEGQSYGMMIAVQLDKQAEFDKLWRFAKTRLQHQSGAREGYFCWRASAAGVCTDQNPATDGEEYFATALFFAAHRWQESAQSSSYAADAQAILDAMLAPRGAEGLTPMFDATSKLPVFSPIGGAATHTLPAYNIPAFFELWAAWADRDNTFWAEAAEASRAFHRASFHPVTGLSPHHANFDGTPQAGAAGDFDDDSSRAIMNVAFDWSWHGKDTQQVVLADRLLGFFYEQGIDHFRQEYRLDGTPKVEWQAISTVAMAATGALAASMNERRAFVQKLWSQPLPTGQYRYFNGLLYCLALLHVSGNFKAYAP